MRRAACWREVDDRVEGMTVKKKDEVSMMALAEKMVSVGRRTARRRHVVGW